MPRLYYGTLADTLGLSQLHQPTFGNHPLSSVISNFPTKSSRRVGLAALSLCAALLCSAAPSDQTVPSTLSGKPAPKKELQLPTSDSPADKTLRELVAKQKEIFAKAEASGTDLDQDSMRSQLQQLAERYDTLLRINANYVPGYVAYGLMLDKVGMSKESAAMMQKANLLNDRLPVVKNQLGNYLAEEGKPLEAFVMYTAAIALDPNEPLYQYQLGTLLVEARDDFLKTNFRNWTRENLDETMQAAFEHAMELTPGDWRYAYRYGMSFYDLGTGEWEAALQFWDAFEKKLKPGIEQQVARLHQAKVLIELRRPDDAQKRLDAVTVRELSRQKAAIAADLDTYRKKRASINPADVTRGEPDPSTSPVLVMPKVINPGGSPKAEPPKAEAPKPATPKQEPPKGDKNHDNSLEKQLLEFP